jgi:hypothetical protein
LHHYCEEEDLIDEYNEAIKKTRTNQRKKNQIKEVII